MDKQLCVSLVKPGSQGESLGILAGDVLTTVNGILVSTNTGLTNAIHKAKEANKGKVELVVIRNGERMTFSATTNPLGIHCHEVETTRSNVQSTKLSGISVSSDYKVARGLMLLFAFVGWVLVVFGIVLAVTAIGHRGSSLLSALPGLGAVVSGFLVVMGAQVTRATVDNADYSREILKTLQKS